MKVAYKNAALLASATGLDLMTTGGAVTLSQIGIAGIGVALGHVGVSVLSGVLTSQVANQIAAKQDLKQAEVFKKAVQTVLASVKNDFLDENEIDTNRWDRLLRQTGLTVADLNDNQTIQSSLEAHFFKPLEKAFTEEDFIREIITEHKELNPGDLISKLINKLNISFPKYRKDYEQPLIDVIKVEFKERFQSHFTQELIKNEPARKVYQIQLLQDSFSYLVTIKQDVTSLLDLAEQQKTSLKGIEETLLTERKELLDQFQEQLQRFLKDQHEIRLIRHHLEKQTDTRDIFRFDHQYTDFQGRSAELDLLFGFLQDKRSFCFYALAGQGGAGKSRLATELCKRAEETGWISGFLNYDTNKHFDWSKFEPKAPTLIVLDYVLGQKEAVINVLTQLSHLQHEDKLQQPVRVLLLDRVYGEELRKDLFTSTTRYHYFDYQNGQEESAYSLPALEQDARWEMIVQLLSTSEVVERTKSLLQEKKAILQALNQLDDQKRPLFVFFSGIALKEGESIADIKRWNTNDALKYHIQRLEKKVWSQVDIWQDSAIRDELKHLIWLAAISQYLTEDDIETIIDKLPLNKLQEKRQETSFWEQLERLFEMRKPLSKDNPIIGMKPDLLAEYFIAAHISKLQERSVTASQLSSLYASAWQVRSEQVWWMSWLTFQHYKETQAKLQHYEDWLLNVTIAKEGRTHHGMILYNLALLYENGGNIEAAEKYYLQAIDKGDVSALNNLAVLYENGGNIEAAEKYYLQAIDKGEVSALNNLAVLYENEGNIASAEKYYLQAIDKGEVSTLNNLAVLYGNEGNIASAEKYYLQAIDKGEVSALNNLAVLYGNEGNIASAEKYYLQAIDKGEVNALYNLALLYGNEGNIASAEKYYLQAIDIGHVSALNNLAVLYKNGGNIASAEKYYLQAIDKGYAGALSNLASFYWQLNNNQEEAWQLINRYLKEHQDDLTQQLARLTYSAWTNREGFYSENRVSILDLITERQPDLLASSLILLFHDRSDILLNYFETSKRAQWIQEKYLTTYLVALHFSRPDDSRLKEIPEELVEDFNSLVTEIKEQRAFYGETL